MKDFTKVVLFSDMDGTLLNSESRVSRENQDAVQEFMAQGGLFGIATGRSQLNSVMFLEDIKVNAPCILYNGCGVYDFDAKKFIILRELSKKRLMLYIEHCLKEFPEVMIQVFCPEMSYFISPEEFADKHIVEIHQPCEFGKIEDIIDQPWIKVLLCGKPEKLKELEGLIKTFHLEEDINWVFSSEIYLELLPFGVTKGSALTKLREHMGPEYKIYAVGDYYNDVEMIEAADVGIAVQNATPLLKEIANVITVNNNESAIADIIYNIIK